MNQAREWPVKTIAECASKEPYSTQIGPFGMALVASEYTASGVPVLRGVNVNRGRFHDDDYVFISDDKADQLKKFETSPGDVLLVHKGTLGKIGLMPTKPRYSRYIMGNSMMRVRCDTTKLLPEYLYYWLSSPAGQHYLFSRVSQVGVPQLQHPLTTLRQASLPVPSLLEQRRITHVLGALDDKIVLDEQMNKTIEAVMGSIFRQWFVNFEFGIGESKPYRSSGGELVHSDKLGRAIPRGWEIGTFSDVIAVNPRRELKKGHEARKIGMADLNPCQADIEAWTYECYKSGPRFQNGDTLLARISPSLEHGKTAFVSILNNNEVGFGSTEFIVLGKKVITSELYIFHLARSDDIRRIAIGAMTGTSGRQRVPDDLFDQMAVAVPPQKLIERFDLVVSPLFRQLLRNANERRTLSKIRDSLLPKLISGLIEVPGGAS